MMAGFRLPTFNLVANVWRLAGTGGNYAAPDVVVACNLSLGERMNITKPVLAGQPTPAQLMWLLVPKLADVRSNFNGAQPDLVEVPAGSKRFYEVDWVDDIGKGFLNEHRAAVLRFFTAGNTTLAGGPFPVPVPLP
jgi:hypothetical protein